MKTTIDTASDEVLVLRSQLGDQLALDHLVERWHPRLWELLHHITLDVTAADDLAQETWLSALRSLARLREPDRFQWWLFTIARRRANDLLRHQYRRGEQPTAPEDLAIDSDLDTPSTRISNTTAANMLVEQRAHLVELLAPLEIELREVLVLHYLHDWPIAEMAATLDLAEGTVKSRLHRARNRLKQTRNAAPTMPQEDI